MFKSLRKLPETLHPDDYDSRKYSRVERPRLGVSLSTVALISRRVAWPLGRPRTASRRASAVGPALFPLRARQAFGFFRLFSAFSLALFPPFTPLEREYWLFLRDERRELRLHGHPVLGIGSRAR